jgi:hypothetical protein
MGDTLYRCMVVDCKTDSCKTNLIIHVFDRVSEGSVFRVAVPQSVPCRPFALTCPSCMVEHTYSSGSIREEIVRNPELQLGEIDPAYRDALKPTLAENKTAREQ